MKTDPSFWVINCYFNPLGSTRLWENFEQSTGLLLAQGANVLTVELLFAGQASRVAADHPVLRVEATDVLWHKERLINLGIEALPAHCTKVAWVDADILFASPDWMQEASSLLDQVEVVQLFDTVKHLPKDHRSYLGESILERPSMVRQIEQYGAGFFENVERGIVARGNPGHAFAARREVLSCGLYDRHILGGNDTIFVYALCGAVSRLLLPTPELRDDALNWEEAFFRSRHTYSFAALSGTIYHLWHGEQQNRGYGEERASLLRTHSFNPAVDIRLNDDGVYTWATPKSALHQGLRTYFHGRADDSSEIAVIHDAALHETLDSIRALERTRAAASDVGAQQVPRITVRLEQLRKEIAQSEQEIRVLKRRISAIEFSETRLSVILPFYQKYQGLQHSLQFNRSFLQRKDLEVVLVVDSSEDAARVLDLVRSEPTIRWRVLVNWQQHEWRNPGVVINWGLRHARAPYALIVSPETVFVDDVPSKFLSYLGYLDRFPSNSAEGRRVALCGRVKFLTYGQAPTVDAPTIPFGSLFVRRMHAFEIEGYNERFEGWGGDDRDFRTRLELAGVLIQECPEIVLAHYETPAELEKRRNRTRDSILARTEQIRSYESSDICQPGFGLAPVEVLYDWRAQHV